MIGDNRLPELAVQIRRAHADVQEAAKTAAQKMIEAGRGLIEAKELCAHGQWLPFLKEAGVHERTAQRYMKLAASNLESDTVSLLGGLNQALRFLQWRETAMHHFTNAEAAARRFEETGEGEEYLLPPIEWGMDCLDEMVRMFPAESLA